MQLRPNELDDCACTILHLMYPLCPRKDHTKLSELSGPLFLLPVVTLSIFIEVSLNHFMRELFLGRSPMHERRVQQIYVS